MIRNRKYFPIIIFLFALTGCQNHNAYENKTINFTVQADTVIGENHEFWKSLGYDFLFKIVNEPEGEELMSSKIYNVIS